MNFLLTILGSGAALPTGQRHCSAQVVNIHGHKALIDCAESTQDRIRHQHIRLQSLGLIFISHMHGDHFFGLPGLLSTMHLCGRTEPIEIVAPVGARAAIEHLFDLTGNHITFPIVWHELDFVEGEQLVYDCSKFSVHAFPLLHSVPTYGFRFEQHPVGRMAPLRYAYCCDTAYSPTLLPHISDVDMLCLECTFANEMAELATQRQHLTAAQAAQLAAESNARQLLLTHISARYREPEPLISQATQIFPNTLLAADGLRLEIRRPTQPQPTENKKQE